MSNVLDDYHEVREKRRGRPRKAGVQRYPSGQIKREPVLTHKERQRNMSTATEARMRHNRLRKAADAQSPEYGYALGRLHLAGVLDPSRAESEIMLKAGNAMGLDYDRYYRLTGIPSPNPQAMDMRRVRGLSGDAPVDDIRRATDKMMAVERVLGCVDTDGKPVMSLCKRIVLRDEDASQWTPFMLKYLRRGLRALAEHYQIERG